MALAAAVGALPPVAARCPCAMLGASSVCAQRAASFAARIRRLCACSARLPPLDADGCAGGAQKPARPSRRLRCAPPVPLLRRLGRQAAAGGAFGRRSRSGCGVGGSRLLPPPSAAGAALAGLAAASRGGGACLPFGRLKPPPLLRPRPPFYDSGAGALACPCGGCPLRRGGCSAARFAAALHLVILLHRILPFQTCLPSQYMRPAPQKLHESGQQKQKNLSPMGACAAARSFVYCSHRKKEGSCADG